MPMMNYRAFGRVAEVRPTAAAAQRRPAERAIGSQAPTVSDVPMRSLPTRNRAPRDAQPARRRDELGTSDPVERNTADEQLHMGSPSVPHQNGSADSSRVLVSRRVPMSRLLPEAASRAEATVRARNDAMLADAELDPPVPAAAAAGDASAAQGLLIGDAPGETSRVTFDWAEEHYNARLRSVQIWLFFIDLRLSLWLLDKRWTYAAGGGFSDARRARRATQLAARARETILRLGPTFIKIGQLFSSRSDLLGAEFVTELSKLQDRVPSFSDDKVLRIVEDELGAPVPRLFRQFTLRPIAAASLGQVHRATLWDGTDVVVKVQRPGLRELFDIDLDALEAVARALDAQDSSRDFVSIYQECRDVLYREIDYLQEGRNADRFRRNFRDTPWVRTPSVVWGLTSRRVLTLAYMPGVKITAVDTLRASGLDCSRIAQRATEAYLTQILKHGYFHADPHPGNIAVDGAGALIFYDFGMMGEIKGNVRAGLLEVFYGTYAKDAERVLTALVGLGVLRPKGGDLVSLKRTLSYLIENLGQQTSRSESLAVIGEDIFAVAVDQPFRFPATFTFVLRAFTTLEGVGRTLDPGYKFAEVAAPYAQELLDLGGPGAVGGAAPDLMLQVQNRAAQVGSAAVAMPDRIEYLEKTLRRMEDGELKLRVRVLESERAARRSALLARAQLQLVASLGCANAAISLYGQGASGAATGSMGLASVFSGLLLRSMWRVRRLDKFEREVGGRS